MRGAWRHAGEMTGAARRWGGRGWAPPCLTGGTGTAPGPGGGGSGGQPWRSSAGRCSPAGSQPGVGRLPLMIAILGAGQMGEALISGLLRAGVVSPVELVAAARRSDRAKELRDAHGIEVLSAAAAARRAETLVITVKPQDMGALLDEISPAVTPAKLVISVAAGITTALFCRTLTRAVPVA